ncbi:CAP domain-containing protein [Thalassovita sp.]|uniref:CAP domain-containing protein n=1 Tax=Thalassovita sp. TaxID=1979401 RepID=UPI002B27A9DF|nr:CAP domain-containing protein [Thalassovita sp.]
MLRLIGLALISVLMLSACTDMVSELGQGQHSASRLYRIRSSDDSAIQYRMLDSINALRKAAGAGAVELDAKLNAAAATHSRDMSVQNRPWHFGSDGSSPLDRVKRVGYSGEFRGENISETYETEIVTLGAWMEQVDTRRVILDPKATDMGFSWYQESNGKIWWTLVLGSRS